jgi:hypothetical protein
LLAVSFVAVAAFLLGVCTDYGQTFLPGQSNSLANSAGPWVLAAFVLTFGARGPKQAALQGALVLVLLEMGYVVAAYLRGYSSAETTTMFWLTAGVVVGPVIGLAAHWVRCGASSQAAAGAGCLSGVLVGEGCYTLIELNTPVYGLGEIVLGAVLLAVFGRRRFAEPNGAALAVAVTVLLAAAFVAIY